LAMLVIELYKLNKEFLKWRLYLLERKARRLLREKRYRGDPAGAVGAEEASRPPAESEVPGVEIVGKLKFYLYSWFLYF
jgi:hypothetical protein